MADFVIRESIRESRTVVKPLFCGGFIGDFGRSRTMSLEARALARIQDDLKEKRYKQTQLAEASGYVDSTISEIVNGKAGLPYDVVEAAAGLRGVDPAEYIVDPASAMRVLNPIEAEFIRYARTWPRDVLSALVTFLQYFAPSSAAEERYRNAVAYLRKMGHNERQQAMAYLLLLSEGRLPADVRAKLQTDLPGGSIDAILVGADPLEIAAVRALAEKAAPRRKRGKG